MNAGESGTPLEEVIEQILEERRRGAFPDLEAVVRRHPEFAEELKELFPALDLLERARDRSPGLRDKENASSEPERVGTSTRARPERTLPLTDVLQRLAGRAVFFERYEMGAEIGRGAQGVVLAVWDEDLHRNLAMKRFLDPGRKGSSGAGSRSLGRFLDEAQVTAQLDHPGIVPVHELGVDTQGGVYFTMKLVKGCDLRAIFELVHAGSEGWTQTRALSVLLKVCEAMAYAHSKGVIHRDLKPSNVMVGRYGEVYVTDWGLSRVPGREDGKDIRIRPEATSELHTHRGEASFDLDSPLVTMQGDVVGTPAYMSPEQARGDLAAMGPQSDVYSLGAMLYQLLAGYMPYVRQGSRLTSHAIWALVQNGPPDPVQALAPNAPVELVAICERAMARDPATRYADMGGLAEDLRAFLENRVVSAHRTGALVEFRKWISRNRELALASAAAILLALGGLAAVGYVQARGKRAADAQRANVMRLSAFQELEDLKALADELWPPWPDHADAYRDWLRRARVLIAGLEPDPRTNDLGHRARLVELEARALPYSDEDREVDRRSHPRFLELGSLDAQIAALDGAQAVRNGDTKVQQVALEEALLPQDSAALNELAWMLVDPDAGVCVEAGRGLALARLAVARPADASVHANHLDTLAWACMANGLDEEALATSQRALDECPAERKADFSESLERLRTGIDAARSGATRSKLEGERADLESELTRRRTWRFATEEERWWHAQLVALIAELQELADPATGLIDGFSPEHGWGITRRLAESAAVAEKTMTSPEAARRWAEAIASISDRNTCTAYDGLILSPQMGLLPLGRDRDSGLWEFAHLLTGEPPKRDAEGKLDVQEDSCLVFVLIPGGRFLMGSQGTDPSGANYDPGATDLGPVHRASLTPFFLSKYEMTQGQWLRVTGSNPSHAGPHFWRQQWSRSGQMADLTHPVEQVRWVDCVQVCKRIGCVLPSEARWEYGARGGTGTIWWTGNDVASLQGAGNISDAYAKSQNAGWGDGYDSVDDGYWWHAPVDSFRANPFGLHNVIGNVFEWCLDGMNDDYYHRCLIEEVTDPVGPETRLGGRMMRGGDFTLTSIQSKSSNRGRAIAESADAWLGLRPACDVRGIAEYSSDR